MIVDDQTYEIYATRDAMGSVTALLDTGGTVQERYGYTAFGKRRVMVADFSDRASSSYDWRLGFHGEFSDTETGYVKYGYRFYSPEIGRWLSRDPIGEHGGVNLYCYVANNSVNLVDPLGLWSDAAKAVWTSLKYAVPGSEIPEAARAAPAAARLLIMNAFEEACMECLCEDLGDCWDPDGICTEWKEVKRKLG